MCSGIEDVLFSSLGIVDNLSKMLGEVVDFSVSPAVVWEFSVLLGRTGKSCTLVESVCKLTTLLGEADELVEDVNRAGGVFDWLNEVSPCLAVVQGFLLVVG